MQLRSVQSWLAGLNSSDTANANGSSVVWIIFGLCSMLRTTPEADPLVWWSGLVIFVGHLVRLGWRLGKRAS